jgi:hypothetical protein
MTAHAVDDYALPGFKPPRGRYVAALVMREISVSCVPALAAQVHHQWALLKHGQPPWSGFGNSVILIIPEDGMLVYGQKRSCGPKCERRAVAPSRFRSRRRRDATADAIARSRVDSGGGPASRTTVGSARARYSSVDL